ncbi:MAG: DUF2723 domain-containing protein [Deltaproteobacteria bacterium]|nr:DUF2723 domain-containing protein [Deltaproteobacteria bacterium]
MRPFIPAALAVCAAALYLLFIPAHLASWDAIQFALGLEHFAMPIHQPHPPGYVGHMALGWLFADLGLATDRAMQAASVTAAALASSAVFFLGRKMYGIREGVVAALIFMLHPLTWFYAVSGESYPAEALLATFLVFVGLDVKEKSSNARLVGFFLVYGLAGGVRQSLPLFFLPFAIWRLFMACSGMPSNRAIIRVFIAGVSASIGIVAWGAPLVSLAGGIEPLLRLFGNQFFSMFGAYYSPLLGASEGAVLTNLNGLWRYGIGALSAGGATALVLAAAGRFKTLRLDRFKGVYLAWVLPPLAWFLLMFIYKAGHMLVLVPAIALFAGRVLVRALPGERRLLSGLLIGGVLAAQTALFLAPPAWWTLKIGDRSWPSIQYAEAHTSSTIDAVRKLAGDDPSSVVVITRDGRFGFRRAMYYLPEFRVLWLMDTDSTGVPRPGVDVCEAGDHNVKCMSGPGFWTVDRLPDTATITLGPGVRHVAWFADPKGAFARGLAGSLPMRSVKAGSISTVPVTDIRPGPVSFRIGGYIFQR